MEPINGNATESDIVNRCPVSFTHPPHDYCDGSPATTRNVEVVVLRKIVHAEPVDGIDGGFLVTLECGHRLATRKKQVSYHCHKCASAKVIGG